MAGLDCNVWGAWDMNPELLKQVQDKLLQVYLGCSYSAGNADVMLRVRLTHDLVQDALNAPEGDRLNWDDLPEPGPDFLQVRKDGR